MSIVGIAILKTVLELTFVQENALLDQDQV